MKTKNLLLITFSLSLIFSSCKKKEGCTDPTAKNYNSEADKDCEGCCEYDASATAQYRLVIENGAKSIYQGEAITYKAHLVDTKGNNVPVSSVTWSVSNSAAGSFSGAVFTSIDDVSTQITATATYEGKTYTAITALSITPPKDLLLFGVAPSAILWEADGSSFQLETFYFGTSAASYTYSSSNSAVATVSASGNITITGAGYAEVTVTGSINGQTYTFIVPIVIIAAPEVKLPVSKILITPKQGDLFRGETQQYTAKAYDALGNDVTSSTSFTWTIEAKDADFPVPAGISTSGLVTANNIGDAYIYASALGVSGQAELVVNPDSFIMVNPFYTQLGGIDPWTGNPNPTEQTLTATAYKIDRALYRSNSANYMQAISMPSGLVWHLPETGFPAMDDLYRVVTLSNATNTTVKATAIPGKVGSAFIIAEIPSSRDLAGAASILVTP